MKIRLDLITVLMLLGMLQAVYQILILRVNGWKYRANRWLVFILFLSIFILFGYFSYLSDLFYSFPYLVGISGFLILGLGPGIFFYARALTTTKRFRAVYLLHFLPLLLILMLNYSWFSMPRNSKIPLIEYYYSEKMTFSWYTLIYLTVILVHLGCYLFVSFKHTSQINNRLKEQESNASLIKIEWLKKILLAFFCYLVTFLFVYIAWSFQSIYTTQIEAYLQLVLSLFIITLGYYMLKSPGLFELLHDVTNLDTTSKYKNSNLSENEAKEIASFLHDNMIKKQYYLNAKLSLSELAKYLDMSPHLLSQVINQEFDMNFFDFVNQYRVEEVKKKLLDSKYKHLSILGIALECGFNSKGAFNRVFKKFVGMSPSAFVKKNT
ncbi:helix-turn-helix domain-containing protein [Flavobacteriaceae bacterium M23B6Z8]